VTKSLVLGVPEESDAGEELSERTGEVTLSRRGALAAAGLASACTARAATAAAVGAVEEVVTGSGLVRVEDARYGFALERPAGWERVEKAGATLLFRDPGYKGNTLGVTVNPVKLQKLSDFGSVEDVGERLLGVEKQKDGFVGVELLRSGARGGAGEGSPIVYEYDYRLDNIHVKKRFLCAVTVADGTMFIVQGAVKQPKEGAPINTELEELVAQAVRSFRLLA